MKKIKPNGIEIELSHLIIILLGAGMIYPVLWLFFASFKEGVQIFSDPGLWPRPWILNNYSHGWTGIGYVPFSAFFLNSFIISIGCVIANALACSVTAYAFARLEFKGKKFWFAILMITFMLPGHVTLIPRYIIFRNLGWIDTFNPFIIPKFFGGDGYFIFLMVQFIRSLPRDMDESAIIDGCGKFRIFTRIILPLSIPPVITTVLFSFLWSWDDFMGHMIFLNSPEKFTVPLGLRLFLDSSGTSSWGAMFAMSVVSLLPCFILFFALQKYFVQGITTTGITG